jgi:hypothetical protein
VLSLLDKRIARRVLAARSEVMPDELARITASIPGPVLLSDADVASFYEKPFSQLSPVQQALSDQYWERRAILPGSHTVQSERYGQ